MEEKVKTNKKKAKKNGGLMILWIVLIIVIIIIAAIALINRNSSDADNEGTDTIAEATDEQYVSVQDDGTKVNISPELSTTKTLNGLEVTNAKLTYNSVGNTVLIANVKNTTSSKIESKELKVDLVDENGDTIVTLRGAIQDLEAGETTTMNFVASADVVNAYDFVIYE